jgi:hypothetical protein
MVVYVTEIDSFEMRARETICPSDSSLGARHEYTESEWPGLLSSVPTREIHPEFRDKSVEIKRFTPAPRQNRTAFTMQRSGSLHSWSTISRAGGKKVGRVRYI